MNVERALPVTVGSLLANYRSNRLGWSLGRLLLFIGRNKEAANADDNKCVLKQFTICDHLAAPLSKIRGQEVPPWRGPNRLPCGSAESVNFPADILPDLTGKVNETGQQHLLFERLTYLLK